MSAKKLAWEPAFVRRAEPLRARIFLRAGLWLTAVPVVLGLVSQAIPSPVPPVIKVLLGWSYILFAAALVAFVLGLLKGRGVVRQGAFALESRSLFIERGSVWRRIPRNTIETAILRPRSSIVSVILTSGVVETLHLRDRDRARMLVAELSRLPARASAT